MNAPILAKVNRPTKICHKKWMFIDGEQTVWRSAAIYT